MHSPEMPTRAHSAQLVSVKRQHMKSIMKSTKFMHSPGKPTRTQLVAPAMISDPLNTDSDSYSVDCWYFLRYLQNKLARLLEWPLTHSNSKRRSRETQRLERMV